MKLCLFTMVPELCTLYNVCDYAPYSPQCSVSWAEIKLQSDLVRICLFAVSSGWPSNWPSKDVFVSFSFSFLWIIYGIYSGDALKSNVSGIFIWSFGQVNDEQWQCNNVRRMTLYPMILHNLLHAHCSLMTGSSWRGNLQNLSSSSWKAATKLGCWGSLMKYVLYIRCPLASQIL